MHGLYTPLPVYRLQSHTCPNRSIARSSMPAHRPRPLYTLTSLTCAAPLRLYPKCHSAPALICPSRPLSAPTLLPHRNTPTLTDASMPAIQPAPIHEVPCLPYRLPPCLPQPACRYSPLLVYAGSRLYTPACLVWHLSPSMCEYSVGCCKRPPALFFS